MIFFSGTDCCGKDTIMHALAKRIDYSVFMSPRSPICSMVYDILYNRQENSFINNMKLIRELIGLDTAFVLIESDPNVLHKRAIARNEKHINTVRDFEKHIELYQDIFDKLKKGWLGEHRKQFVHVINNGTVDEAVCYILKELKESNAKY